MSKKLRTKVKRVLGDPVWQSIAAFIAFMTLIVTLLGIVLVRPHPQGTNRVIFSSDTSKELTDFPEPVSNRMQILIDGKEERAIRLFIVRVEYKGEQPIHLGDFEGPIRASIPR